MNWKPGKPRHFFILSGRSTRKDSVKSEKRRPTPIAWLVIVVSVVLGLIAAFVVEPNLPEHAYRRGRASGAAGGLVGVGFMLVALGPLGAAGVKITETKADQTERPNQNDEG
jgi:hypothetical protein